MDGKTGSTIVGHRIEDQPGEGVVALQHVSEIGIVKNNAYEVVSVSDGGPKIMMAELSCPT